MTLQCMNQRELVMKYDMTDTEENEELISNTLLHG